MFSTTSTRGDIAPGETIEPYTGFQLQLRWLDRWLHDEPNGVDTEPPVLIYVQGPNAWRQEHDWPLPDEKRIRLYLSDEQTGTVDSLNDGALAAALPTRSASAHYGFDPQNSRNPVDVSNVAMQMVVDGPPVPLDETLPAGAERPYGRLIMDKSSYEAQALTWTSEPVAAPTEITGFPTLVLWATVSTPDAGFIAELMDVGPVDERPGSWSSVQITRGSLRAGAQFSRTGPVDIRTDDVVRYELELSPTSFVLPAGHRLRITVQGAPIDPAYKLAWQGPGLSEQPFSFTVYGGPAHASFVELPVIGATPAF